MTHDFIAFLVWKDKPPCGAQINLAWLASENGFKIMENFGIKILRNPLKSTKNSREFLHHL
jgi:hypothetical protein